MMGRLGSSFHAPVKLPAVKPALQVSPVRQTTRDRKDGQSAGWKAHRVIKNQGDIMDGKKRQLDPTKSVKDRLDPSHDRADRVVERHSVSQHLEHSEDCHVSYANVSIVTDFTPARPTVLLDVDEPVSWSNSQDGGGLMEDRAHKEVSVITEMTSEKSQKDYQSSSSDEPNALRQERTAAFSELQAQERGDPVLGDAHPAEEGLAGGSLSHIGVTETRQKGEESANAAMSPDLHSAAHWLRQVKAAELQGHLSVAQRLFQLALDCNAEPKEKIVTAKEAFWERHRSSAPAVDLLVDLEQQQKAQDQQTLLATRSASDDTGIPASSQRAEAPSVSLSASPGETGAAHTEDGGVGRGEPERGAEDEAQGDGAGLNAPQEGLTGGDGIQAQVKVGATVLHKRHQSSGGEVGRGKAQRAGRRAWVGELLRHRKEPALPQQHGNGGIMGSEQVRAQLGAGAKGQLRGGREGGRSHGPPTSASADRPWGSEGHADRAPVGLKAGEALDEETAGGIRLATEGKEREEAEQPAAETADVLWDKLEAGKVEVGEVKLGRPASPVGNEPCAPANQQGLLLALGTLATGEKQGKPRGWQAGASGVYAERVLAWEMARREWRKGWGRELEPLTGRGGRRRGRMRGSGVKRGRGMPAGRGPRRDWQREQGWREAGGGLPQKHPHAWFWQLLGTSPLALYEQKPEASSSELPNWGRRHGLSTAEERPDSSAEQLSGVQGSAQAWGRHMAAEGEDTQVGALGLPAGGEGLQPNDTEPAVTAGPPGREGEQSSAGLDPGGFVQSVPAAEPLPATEAVGSSAEESISFSRSVSEEINVMDDTFSLQSIQSLSPGPLQTPPPASPVSRHSSPGLDVASAVDRGLEPSWDQMQLEGSAGELRQGGASLGSSTHALGPPPSQASRGPPEDGTQGEAEGSYAEAESDGGGPQLLPPPELDEAPSPVLRGVGGERLEPPALSLAPPASSPPISPASTPQCSTESLDPSPAPSPSAAPATISTLALTRARRPAARRLLGSILARTGPAVQQAEGESDSLESPAAAAQVYGPPRMRRGGGDRSSLDSSEEDSQAEGTHEKSRREERQGGGALPGETASPAPSLFSLAVSADSPASPGVSSGPGLLPAPLPLPDPPASVGVTMFAPPSPHRNSSSSSSPGRPQQRLLLQDSPVADASRSGPAQTGEASAGHSPDPPGDPLDGAEEAEQQGLWSTESSDEFGVLWRRSPRAQGEGGRVDGGREGDANKEAPTPSPSLGRGPRKKWDIGCVSPALATDMSAEGSDWSLRRGDGWDRAAAAGEGQGEAAGEVRHVRAGGGVLEGKTDEGRNDVAGTHREGEASPQAPDASPPMATVEAVLVEEANAPFPQGQHRGDYERRGQYPPGRLETGGRSPGRRKWQIPASATAGGLPGRSPLWAIGAEPSPAAGHPLAAQERPAAVAGAPSRDSEPQEGPEGLADMIELSQEQLRGEPGAVGLSPGRGEAPPPEPSALDGGARKTASHRRVRSWVRKMLAGPVSKSLRRMFPRRAQSAPPTPSGRASASRVLFSARPG